MIGALTWTVVAPLLAGAFCLTTTRGARWFALLGSLVPLAIGLAALGDCARHPSAEFRMQESYPWALGAAWSVGVDGISAAMLALSGLVVGIATISGWNQQRSPRGYHALVMLLLAAMNGVFVTRDLLVFYICWEAMLVPMLALIGVWGGQQRRYAAMKFFVFTLAGSVLMLAMLIAMWNALPADGKTFSIPALVAQWRLWEQVAFLGLPLAAFGFLAVLLAALVKVPAVPLHTWLPHAHVQAPTAISVILAGILLKLGVYALYRLAWPLFPAQAVQWGWLIGLIGVVGILWGAWVALGQRDLKRLVAYSSVSHMGFCLLGLASLSVAGVTGGMVQAVTHGLSSSLLFLLVGVVYDRAHHREVDGFGGLAAPMPRFAWVLLIACLAGAGLPGLAGFPGEAMTLFGSFSAGGTFAWLAAAATVSVVLSAAYLLWMLKRVAYGPLRHPDHAAFADLDARELAATIPLVALIVVIGVWPSPLADALRPSCEALVNQVRHDRHLSAPAARSDPRQRRPGRADRRHAAAGGSEIRSRPARRSDLRLLAAGGGAQRPRSGARHAVVRPADCAGAAGHSACDPAGAACRTRRTARG